MLNHLTSLALTMSDNDQIQGHIAQILAYSFQGNIYSMNSQKLAVYAEWACDDISEYLTKIHEKGFLDQGMCEAVAFQLQTADKCRFLASRGFNLYMMVRDRTKLI